MVTLLASLATGCLPVPHTHVRQPAATFRVEDSTGAPMVGARITLFGGYAVGHRILDSTAIETDVQGIATLPRERERHLWMMLMPDADAPWRWAFCVRAPGRAPQSGFLDGEPRDTIRIRLSGGSPPGCGAAPRTLHDVMQRR